jgi:hypothetical protein
LIVEPLRVAQPRIPGQYEGQFIVPDNFNDPLPESVRVISQQVKYEAALILLVD